MTLQSKMQTLTHKHITVNILVLIIPSWALGLANLYDFPSQMEIQADNTFKKNVNKDIIYTYFDSDFQIKSNILFLLLFWKTYYFKPFRL